MIKLGLDFCPQFLLCFWSPMMSESANVASLGAMPTAQPSNAGIRKQWHEDITQDLRNHLVHKLWVANIKIISCWVSCCPRGVLGAEGLQKGAWLAKLEGQRVNLVRMHEKGKQKPKRRSCICWFGAVVLEVSHSILKPSARGSVPWKQQQCCSLSADLLAVLCSNHWG